MEHERALTTQREEHERVLAAAAEVQEETEMIAKLVAHHGGGEFLGGSLKHLLRAQEKATLDNQGSAERLFDLSRAGVSFRTVDALLKGLRYLVEERCAAIDVMDVVANIHD